MGTTPTPGDLVSPLLGPVQTRGERAARAEADEQLGLTVRLTPAQASAVEIYITDPLHEENVGRFELRGRKLAIAADVTCDEAWRVLVDASNACDSAAECLDCIGARDAAVAERRASRSLGAIASRVLRMGGAK